MPSRLGDVQAYGQRCNKLSAADFSGTNPARLAEAFWRFQNFTRSQKCGNQGDTAVVHSTIVCIIEIVGVTHCRVDQRCRERAGFSPNEKTVAWPLPPQKANVSRNSLIPLALLPARMHPMVSVKRSAVCFKTASGTFLLSNVAAYSMRGRIESLSRADVDFMIAPRGVCHWPKQ